MTCLLLQFNNDVTPLCSFKCFQCWSRNDSLRESVPSDYCIGEVGIYKIVCPAWVSCMLQCVRMFGNLHASGVVGKHCEQGRPRIRR